MNMVINKNEEGMKKNTYGITVVRDDIGHIIYPFVSCEHLRCVSTLQSRPGS